MQTLQSPYWHLGTGLWALTVAALRPDAVIAQCTDLLERVAATKLAPVLAVQVGYRWCVHFS